jgi:hypothetical protein
VLKKEKVWGAGSINSTFFSAEIIIFRKNHVGLLTSPIFIQPPINHEKKYYVIVYCVNLIVWL